MWTPSATSRRVRPFRPGVEELEPRTVPSAGLAGTFLPHGGGFLKTSDDPGLTGGYQYGLVKIQAEQAWDLTTGRADVVVADLDSGIDYAHPDLYLNVWINQHEIPEAVRGNLTDVDGDGLITFWDLNDPAGVNLGEGKITDLNGNDYIDGGDLLAPIDSGGWADGRDQDPFSINGRSYSLADDLIGWDFWGNRNDPLDAHGHGTHTAGTIGAIGNNGFGVVGVNWKVSIMALRIGDGGPSTAAAVDALYYAVHHGVRVSNNSWEVGFDQALHDAVRFAGDRGHVVVAAAGNSGINNDKHPMRAYPASFDLDNVIAVAATDENDAKPKGSNYGPTSVDLGAPGVNVASTVPGGFAFADGTSMAAPHVAGTVGLILAHARDLGVDLTAGQIKAKILNSADPVSSLDGKTVTGGRLNAFKALTDSGVPPPDGGGGGGGGGGGKGKGNGGGNSGFAGLGFAGGDPAFLGTPDAPGDWSLALVRSQDQRVATVGGPAGRQPLGLPGGVMEEAGRILGGDEEEVVMAGTPGAGPGQAVRHDDDLFTLFTADEGTARADGGLGAGRPGR